MNSTAVLLWNIVHTHTIFPVLSLWVESNPTDPKQIVLFSSEEILEKMIHLTSQGSYLNSYFTTHDSHAACQLSVQRDSSMICLSHYERLTANHKNVAAVVKVIAQLGPQC